MEDLSSDHETAYRLLSCLCEKFSFDANIEFACFELFDCYVEDLFKDFRAQRTCRWINQHEQLHKQLDIDYVGSHAMLHLFALMSLCAKYFGHENCREVYRTLQVQLSRNNRDFSCRQMLSAEFNVFRSLNFHVIYFRLRLAEAMQLIVAHPSSRSARPQHIEP